MIRNSLRASTVPASCRVSAEPATRHVRSALPVQPAIAEAVPEPLAALGGSEPLQKRARDLWQERVPELHRVGLVTALDGDALARYCQLEALRQDCAHQVAREGVGDTRRSAAATMLLEVSGDLRTLGGELGLTPRTRHRLEARPIAEEVDPTDPVAVWQTKAEAMRQRRCGPTVA